MVMAAAQTIVLRDGSVSTKLNLWGFKRKHQEKKMVSKMREKYLQRVYQIKDLNPECTRTPKKQPNLKISNISKCKEVREISNKNL